MAIFHVHARVISKGNRAGHAAGLARYLTGSGREGHGRSDVVASGAGALPAWARDGVHFFRMADRFESRGMVLARHYQITLPRELSPDARLEVAEDLRAAFFARYPHVWSVHNPPSRDGSGEQPHMDVMFSTRREDTAIARTPKQWFARAAAAGRDPRHGGVRKDPIWEHKYALQGVRRDSATLINAALERTGVAVAVSPDWERGHRHDGATRLASWQAYKARAGIHDVSRAAILDHVRDQFWRHDHSPAREGERQQSFMRGLERELQRAERGQQRETRVPVHARNHALVREDAMHGGVHVQLAREYER
jgi:hypothetical protein